MPTEVAERTPSGIDLRGFLRSPERPTPAVIPVNAGKTIAKTSMNRSPPSTPWKTADVPVASSGIAEPAKNITSDATSTATIPQSAPTPMLAPRVTTSSRSTAVPGSDTSRGSKGIPAQASNAGASGRNASAKAIM